MARDLFQWDVEDESFWQQAGAKIARRNLWISIPCLLCGFAVWLMWGIISVQMLNLGFPFTNQELFSLTAIAGFSGATLRIPSTFFIRLAGGRNTIFFTTALLMIPAAGAGFALLDRETPLWVFQLFAFLSGIGGGNFASSMSNISFFFPKRVQGTSLGLNAGLGNFGVTTMQVLVPLSMTFAIFGGGSMVLENTSGTLIGKIPRGTEAWIHNAGFVWLLFLAPLALASWFGMNAIRTETASPNVGSPMASMAKIAALLSVAMIIATFALLLILPAPHGVGGDSLLIRYFVKNKWIALPCAIAATLSYMRLIPGEIGRSLGRQFKIFRNGHTWVMTIIYTMTFGSFIGFSAAFPLAIKVIFGFTHVADASGVMTHDTPNPNGPSALMFAWMGPFIGALIRPVGGWISDRVGGAKVTQAVSVVMVVAALGAAYFMTAAYRSAMPEEFFWPFFVLFIILFTASGIGNGSTFRSIAIIFDEEQTGPVLGWTSAVAAYGAFVIPQIFGEQIRAATPQHALFGFAAFYLACLILNWWAYLGPRASIRNP